MSLYDMSWVEHMFMKHIWSASAQGRKITYVMYVSAEGGGTKSSPGIGIGSKKPPSGHRPG
jgi:hypothetical protein